MLSIFKLLPMHSKKGQPLVHTWEKIKLSYHYHQSEKENETRTCLTKKNGWGFRESWKGSIFDGQRN